MAYIPLEKLIRKEDGSLYKLVLTASARANELTQGANPLLETESKKVSTIALEEIANNVVTYEEVKAKARKQEKAEKSEKPEKSEKAEEPEA